MKLSKIYNPQEMNSYQFVAVTGLVMTVVAHIILIFLGKFIESFEALYLCWVVFFVLGTIANLRDDGQGHDHHHHH